MAPADDRDPKQVFPLAESSRVNRLELFFDLVFVFAFLNVTRLMAESLDGRGLVQGFLLLTLLWWCWCSFAFTGNAVRIDQGMMPAVLFTATAAILVVAVTTPEAFGDRPGGILGPLVFPICYFVVRALSFASVWYVVAEKKERRIVLRAARPVPIATALLTLAAVTPWLFGTAHETPIRIALWTLAIGVEYGASVMFGTRGWKIISASHWAERHALILIVALGEAIISVGGSGRPVQWSIGWPVLAAVLAGIAVAASLWWYYFDFIALAAELALQHATGARRVALALTAYTYLHLLMIAGIILFALGMQQVLHHVSEGVPSEPLHAVDRIVLYGGVILYLLGHLGFQLRMLGTVSWTRVVTIGLLAALVPAGQWLLAPRALVLLAGVCVGLVLVENKVFAGSRRAVREAVLEEQRAHEARESEWRRHRYH
jgi:low temperature requirement protein LtrA